MKNLTKTALTLLSMVALVSFGITANAQQKSGMSEAQKALEAFPAAQKGMVRHVIQLKKQSDESVYKVEIIPGKMMLVDCNMHTLMGKLESKDLQGWGYNYYEFSSNGQTRSTMMACNKPDENKFVQAQTLTLNYNSRMPIVIYAPEGYEVKYRIWKADKKMMGATLK